MTMENLTLDLHYNLNLTNSVRTLKFCSFS